MLYNSFQNERLSALGFGAMRLPLLPGTEEIDQAELDRMVDAAIAAGVNYFDTAYAYHGGKSENAIGASLRRYPRESWNLADKFPGHQNVKGLKPMQPEEVFEEQLKKCGVDYFDFYLLHNICENSLTHYYGMKINDCLSYFLEQKEKGRIRHLGFSSHATAETLAHFLDEYGEHFEFCQIQLNYVDWKLQNAKKKVELLRGHGIPVWVMEPVRGGRLAHFDEVTEAKMRALRPDESIPAWAFRWLQTVTRSTMVLSGMSNMAQMEDNIRTFSTEKPLDEKELALLGEIREMLAKTIPCTGCRYCCAGCPMELNIPEMLAMSNEMAIGSSITTIARYTALGEGKRADACIGCGQCVQVCPQNIEIPTELEKLAEIMAKPKSWEQICAERAAAAAALKAKG